MPRPALPSPLKKKWDRLREVLQPMGSVGVAFSGGVDSTVLALAAHRFCRDEAGKRSSAIAFTAVSPSLATGEKEECEALARRIGIAHRIIHTDEIESEAYRANGPDRCFHCKSSLYSHLERIAPSLGVDILLNGANRDDIGDHRPGMIAAAQFSVRSPLLECGLGKDEIRSIAQAFDLPVWDKPAMPCLSSRIAYGVEVTAERLMQIDQAEAFLKQLLNERELRVRIDRPGTGRIELPPGSIPVANSAPVFEQICHKFRELGIQHTSIDPRGLRSGSLNDALTPSELVTLQPLRTKTSSDPN